MEILWQTGARGGGSGTGFDGIVTVFSDLPVDDSADVGEVWLVRQSEGTWFFNRKQRGLYQRINDTGVREDDWQYLGEWEEEFADGNFQVYNTSDPTKVVKLDVSTVATATTRTLIVPNADGTIALLSDVAAALSDAMDYTDAEVATRLIRTGYDEGDIPVANSSGGLTALPAPLVPGYIIGSGIGGAVSWVEAATNFVTSVTGTANQVLVNGGSGAAVVGPVTLTLPQNIHTAASPTFAGLTLSSPLSAANGGTGLSSLGTGVATALGINVGSAGALVVNGGALGTPSSGTVTNLTGTASININGTVGATTPSTVAATTLSSTVSVNGPLGFLLSNPNTGASARVAANILNDTNALNIGLLGSNWAGAFLTGGPTTESGFIYTSANIPISIGIFNAEVARFTSTGLNATAIGATTPSTGSFTAVTIGSTALLSSTVALSSTPGVGAGTLTNAPGAGNPTKWLRINDNGTPIYIPAWVVP